MSITLDPARLLGFRLVTDVALSARIGTKFGTKPGAKPSPIAMSAKVGGKPVEL